MRKITEVTESTFEQNHSKSKKEKCTYQRCNTENPEIQYYKEPNKYIFHRNALY